MGCFSSSNPHLNPCRLGLIWIFALSLWAISPSAEGQDSTWTGTAGDGLWSTAGNWSLGVPGVNPGDVATFNLAAGSVIDLDGTQTSGGIVFGGTPGSFTIGESGDILILSQTADNTDNDSAIIMNASVTNDQTIAADIVLGDGAGTTQFSDQIDIVNFSSTANLLITGDISAGTGAGPGDVQRLIWGGFNSNATTTEFSGTINETSTAVSASRIDMFVGGAELTWAGSVNTTTNNYLQTIIRDDGTLTLSAGSDIGTGLMEVRSGTLNVNSDQTFSNGLIIGQGSQGNTVAINIGAANTIALDSTLTYVVDDNNANTGTISGGTLQLTGANRSFAINNNETVPGAEVTIASDITNDGTERTLIKANQGTLQLSGNNTHGDTTVSNGLLILSGGSALSDTNLLTVNQNGSLGIARFDSSETIGSLAGTGTVDVQSNTLTVGDASNTEFSGLVTGTTGGLTKIGSGTLTLSNTGTHTYSGNTTINDGILSIDGTLSGDVIVGTSGNIGGEGGTTGNLTFGTGTYTLDIDASTSEALSTTGNLDATAATSITVNINGVGTGDVTVLDFNTRTGSGVGAGAGNFMIGTIANPSARGFQGFSDTGNAIVANLGSVVNTWQGTDAINANFWDVSTTANWTNSIDSVFEQGDSVVFGDTASQFSISRREDVTVDEITFNNTVNAYTLTAATGAEILTIESAVNADNTAAVDINGPVAVTNGLTIEGSGDLTFGGAISGSGGLIKNGSGTTTLTTAPTYSGTSFINGGVLELQGAAVNTPVVSNYVIANGATLNYNTSNNDSTALDVSGDGTFLKTGAGTFSLISSQSDWALGGDGLVHVQEGIFSFGGPTPGRWGNNLADMQIDSGASFQGRATSIFVDVLTGEGTFGVGGRNTGDGTGVGLTLGVNNGTGIFSGVIQNSTDWGTGFDTADLNLEKVGTGTQTLNGNNTYTGETTISAGQLNIGGTNVSEFLVGDGTGSGANLGGEGSTSGNITFNETTHTLEADASTVAALGSTGTGALDVSALSVGGFTVNITGTNLNSASGVTVLTYGSGGFAGDVDRFTLGTGAVRASGGTFTDDGLGNITVDLGNVTNTWRGADPDNPTLWDVGTTENWSNTDDQVFQQGDAVVFDDTAAGTTATLQQDTFVDTITFDNNSKSITLNAAASEVLTVANGITTNGTGTSSIDSALTGTNGIVFGGAGDLTINGVISGSGGLIKNGTGTTTLTAAPTYSGAVSVNEGTLVLSNLALAAGTSSNNTATIASGATLEINTNSGNRSIDAFDHGGDGTFLKTGGNQFSQTSSQSDITYSASGLIHVAEGIYNFGGSTPGRWQTNLGDMRIDSGATFEGRSTSIFIDALDGEGTFGVGGQIGANPGLTLGVSDGDGVFDGVIRNTTADGAAFSITKVGSGTQSLNGNNTYTGDTLISSGQLNIGGTNVSNITVGTGLSSGANIGGEGSTSGNLIFAETSHILEIDAGTTAALGTTGTGTTDWTAATGNITVNVTGSGVGPITVLTYGSGGINGSSLSNLVLGSGASARGAGSFTDDLAGNITIDLGYQNASWLGNDSLNPTFWDVATTANWGTTDTFFQTGDDVTFGDGASDFNPTLQSDLSAGAVSFEANSNVYTLGTVPGQTLTTTTGVSVSGASNVILDANIAGTGGLDVSGGGIVTLNGANTYTGDTTVSNGTLTLGSNDVIGDTSAVVVTGGSLNFIDGVIETLHSLQLSGTSLQLGFNDGAGAADLTLNNNSSINAIRVGTTSALRLADGANLSVGDVSQLGTGDSITFDIGVGATATVSGNVNSGNGDGALDKTGAGTLRLSANGSAWGGGTRITGGVLEFQSISNVGSDPDLNDSSLGNADTLNVLQIGSNTTAATLRMFGTNAKNVSDRLVQLGDAGGTIDVEEAAQTLTLNGVISNDTANGGSSGSLTKAGAGTLVLGGNNTYSGGTTISGGTLQVSTGGNLGDSGANVVNNAALVFDTADSNTYSGVFSGSGTLTHSGTGTTTLSGTNTYTGSTSVTGGTLLINGDSSGATGNVTVASGGTLGGSNGTIGGATSFDGGTLSAGTTTTVGILNMAGDLSASSSSTWLVDLNNAVSGESDLIALGDISTRTIDLTNFNLSLNDFGTFNLSTGFTYDIATYTDTNGPLTSTFAGLANGSQINGSTGQYIITYGNQNGFGGNDYSIRLTAVPEPTTFLLLAPLLFAGFWMMRRRRAENRETAEA